MNPSSPGRPLKYGYIIKHLDPQSLYSPAAIAQLALTKSLIPANTEEQKRLSYRRVRIAMGRYSNNHRFPDEGDGSIILNGQSPTPAWFGWRWQKSMGVSPNAEVPSE